MKMSIKDRMVLPDLYPPRGDFPQQLFIREIRKKTELSLKEMEYYEFRHEGGRVFWDEEKAKDDFLDVNLSHSELTFLNEQIDRMDREKAITQDNLDLCIKLREEVRSKDPKKEVKQDEETPS